MDAETRGKAEASRELLRIKLGEDYKALMTSLSHEIRVAKSKKIMEGREVFLEEFQEM